ncbi:MAG TPA: PEP-CTERM sorting domain-containing protein [Thermoguttaceae bacterium]|nr:PEP-CTERM sorting domain-containing protein [Thermoguttaceae bacterium]
MKASIVPLAAVVVLVAVGQVKGMVIADEDFLVDDWSHLILYSCNFGQATLDFTQRELSGGNPDDYQKGQHTLEGTSSLIFDGHLFVGGGTYDPSSQAAVQSIDISYDTKTFTPPGAASGLFLKQGGVNYIHEVNSNYYTDWSTVSETGLLATDPWWYVVGSSGTSSGSPDFSATGAPMEFGYYTFNWIPLVMEGLTVFDWGIDNFSVTVNPVPEPSTLIVWSLLATLGITVGWWRRKRAACG